MSEYGLNESDVIALSYDLQAGSYVQGFLRIIEELPHIVISF